MSNRGRSVGRAVPWLAVVLAGAVAAALAGCGGGGTTRAVPSYAGVVPVGHTVSAPPAATTPAPAGATGAGAGAQAVTLQVLIPREGEQVSGAAVLVAGASEPPAQITINGRPAVNEGIAFRVILHYRRHGRQLVRIRATYPGFRAAEGWIAFCLGSRGRLGVAVPTYGHGVTGLALGVLKNYGRRPASLAQAQRVRCPASG